MAKARRAWLIYRSFWTSPAPLARRLLVYEATVRTALLSGLDAQVLPRVYVDCLESWEMSRLRALLRGDARGQNNAWVRGYCRISSVASTLRKRRCAWLQSIMKNPRHHVAFLAAVAGELDDKHRQLHNGHIALTANPWLRQFGKDVDAAASLGAALACTWSGDPRAGRGCRLHMPSWPSTQLVCWPMTLMECSRGIISTCALAHIQTREEYLGVLGATVRLGWRCIVSRSIVADLTFPGWL
mmetsp:Transcript_102320/g.330073  ORF Transcript_102320/g.330073 Transcript_102320/m.330073 type:complete len:242 (+) Transcript_102320:311-1036(+)